MEFFNPNAKVIYEVEYFQVKNEIFDLNYIVIDLIKGKSKSKDDGKYFKEFRDINQNEITIYSYLCRCGNNKDNCFPSISDISLKTRIGETKVKEAIRVLYLNGFFYKENRVNESGKKTSNLYIVNKDLKDLQQRLFNNYGSKECKVEITETEYTELLNHNKFTIKSDSRTATIDTSHGDHTDSRTATIDTSHGDYKKEQQEKEQHSTKNTTTTSKKTVVVSDEDFSKVEMYVKDIAPNSTDKEIKSIAIDLISVEGVIYIDTLRERFSAIKQYIDKNGANNVIGLIRKAIKEQYKSKSEGSKNSFGDFEQRDYDFLDLESKLIGVDLK